MSKRALIGYSGFVGGNLMRQSAFDDLYNSKNIEDISSRSFDLVVCAGAPAEKWRANKDPEADMRAIRRLADSLAGVSAREFILISTVDTYPAPKGVDEDTVIEPSSCHHYGRHRLWLEEFVRERFSPLVVRLPGLFGTGLKKNIIYDFMHDNNVERIHSEAVFQFYNLDNLWKDIEVAMANSLKLVNFATEPTSVAEVASRAFGLDFDNRPYENAPMYDVRSKYAGLFGGSGGYLYDKRSVLEGIRQFVASGGGR